MDTPQSHHSANTTPPQSPWLSSKGDFVADDMAITLSNLTFHAHHGVLEQERKVGNEYTINATLHYEAADAMATDNISNALNYAQVVDVIHAQMQTPSHLLEHVAARITRTLLSTFTQITRGTITITKNKPPFPRQSAGASFTLSFHRAHKC